MGRHHELHQAPLGTAAHLHDKLHCVLPVSNSRRWRTRYEHLNDTVAHLRAQGTEPWVIECAFGARAHASINSENARHVFVRTPHELWHKENLINLAVARFPADWQYVLWADADVTWARPDLINETVQMLQHHPVVQCFSEAWDLGPNFETVGKHEGFVRSYQLGRDRNRIACGSTSTASGPAHNIWHPGYAWAMRRDAWDQLGGLIDFAILGAADNHMACALTGQMEKSVHPKMHDTYRRWLYRWQDKAEKYIRRDVGVVDGTLLHKHHGPKGRRLYWERWKILTDNQFNPERDLKRDWQGVWQLNDDGSARFRALRDGIKEYQKQRNEDDSCLE